MQVLPADARGGGHCTEQWSGWHDGWPHSTPMYSEDRIGLCNHVRHNIFISFLESKGREEEKTGVHTRLMAQFDPCGTPSLIPLRQSAGCGHQCKGQETGVGQWGQFKARSDQARDGSQWQQGPMPLSLAWQLPFCLTDWHRGKIRVDP